MNFGDTPEGYFQEQAEHWKKIAKQMAKVIMDLGEGNDAHDKGNALVEKHFPKLYKSYE